jgi:hypothetical protein
MTDVIGDTWPWPGTGNAEDAAASETTQGRATPTPWVIIAVNLNPGEAAIIKSRLASEDIPALVQQEAIGSALGLTVGPLGSAKVLVPQPLAERALEILADTFEKEGDWEIGDW